MHDIKYHFHIAMTMNNGHQYSKIIKFTTHRNPFAIIVW